MTKVISPNEILQTLSFNVFYGYDPTTPIQILYNCTEAYQNTPDWNYFTNFIETELNIEGEWYYEILNEDGSITYQYLECTSDTVVQGKWPNYRIFSFKRSAIFFFSS